jgi:hypothetical protein
MKKIIGLCLILAFSQAHATYYSLESCTFKWVPEYNQSLYLGIYKSQYGNYFSKYFTSYCPASINN